MFDRNRYEELVQPALITIERGVQHWADRKTEQDRLDRYRKLQDLEASYDEFEEEQFPEIPADLRRAAHRKFERAEAVLGAADSLADDGGLLVSEVPDAAVEAELLLNEYRELDTYDVSVDVNATHAGEVSELKRRLTDTDDDLYDLVTTDLAAQVDRMEQVLDGRENDLSPQLMEAYKQAYMERRNKIEAAGFLYLEENGFRHVVGEVEAAVREVVTATETQRAVKEEFRSLLDEELSATLDTVNASLREHRVMIEQELRGLERQIAETDRGADTTEVTEELAQLRERIEEMTEETHREQEAITERRAAIEGLESRLEKRIHDIEAQLADVTDDGAATLLEEQLDRLADQQAEIEVVIDQLDRQQSSFEATRKQLAAELDDLETRAEHGPADDIVDREHEGDEIPATLARIYERDFLTRVEESVIETGVTLSDGERIDRDATYWKTNRRQWDQRHRISDESEALQSGTPLGEAVQFDVTRSNFGGLFQDRPLVLRAMVVGDLERFASAGAASRPLGRATLLQEVDNTLAEVDRSDAQYLIGLASPTGWRDEVIDLLREEEFSRFRFGTQIGIVLVDLRDGTIHFDRDDEIAAANHSLFERPLPSEQVSRVQETLEQDVLPEVTQYLSVSDALQRIDVEGHVVVAAFESLAEAGWGRVERLNDEVCLVFET
ncbi:MAG: hypothetical protein V5A32_03435 [Halovenus sp.]